MIAHRVQPNEVSYNSLINLLVKVKEIQRAKEMFEFKFQMENLINDKNELNLHHFSHGTAWIAILQFLEMAKEWPLTIITGKGLHSQRELYEMRDYILEKIAKDFPNLTAEVTTYNEGRIIIRNKTGN